MGTGAIRRGVIVAAVAAAAAVGCGPGKAARGPANQTIDAQVVAEFERAVLGGRETYSELFDFVAVGKYEKLLHRYDALGRSRLDDAQRATFLREDATPFTPERERRNLGNFFPILAQRTVGTGDCHVVPVASEYARLLGQPFEPLPAEPASNAEYEPLRVEVNALIERGGVVALRCDRGQGALALVWTRTADARGWTLITMYDDVVEEAKP